MYCVFCLVLVYETWLSRVKGLVEGTTEVDIAAVTEYVISFSKENLSVH